jgi:hypothetical protein
VRAERELKERRIREKNKGVKGRGERPMANRCGKKEEGQGWNING